ncbi:Eukaryotic translation initiation factor 3 subunit I, partial [Dictyocoela roeselum]
MTSYGTQINMTLHTRPITTTRFFGDYLFVTSLDNLVSIWDLDGNLVSTFEGHDGAVWTVDCNDFAVSGGSDKKFILWDLSNGKTLGQRENNSTVKSVVAMKNGCLVVTDDSYNFKSMVGFYDRRSSRMERIFFPGEVATQVVNNFVEDRDYFSYGKAAGGTSCESGDNCTNDFDSKEIAASNPNAGTSHMSENAIIFSDVAGFLNILDLRNLKIVDRKKIHDSKITELRKSKCGSFMISSSADMTSNIVDFDLSVKRTFISNDPVNSSALSPENDKLLNAGGIPARDVTTTKSIRRFDVNFYDVV